jgi:hypothetical protein
VLRVDCMYVKLAWLSHTEQSSHAAWTGDAVLVSQLRCIRSVNGLGIEFGVCSCCSCA